MESRRRNVIWAFGLRAGTRMKMDENENRENEQKEGLSGEIWVRMANRRQKAAPPYYQEESEPVDWERMRRLQNGGRRNKRGKRNRALLLFAVGTVLLTLLAARLGSTLLKSKKSKEAAEPSVTGTKNVPENTQTPAEPSAEPPFEITVEEHFLTPNEYSRPGLPIEQVNGIVIHYVGNPGTEAISNRNFFESLKDNHETSVSSHFVIGLKGEIIWCVPLNEVAYANRGRNSDTISIECCHPDEDGKFNDDTYRSLVELAAYLYVAYGLEEDDIMRHYEVTGKECPRYYVRNADAWEQLKKDILEETKKHPDSVLVTK